MKILYITDEPSRFILFGGKLTYSTKTKDNSIRLRKSDTKFTRFQEMSVPLVSVVIPTINRQRKLIRAIESVLDQKYPNLEIIVVDGNPDRELSRVLPTSDEITILNQSTKGVAGARNIGISSSNGQYVAFLDDDDVWLEGKLKTQIELLENSRKKTGLVYSGNRVLANGGEQYVYTPNNRGDVFDSLLVGNFIPSPTPIVKRECFSNVGMFDESLTALEDYDMWLRIAQEYLVDYINLPLAITYHGHERKSEMTGDVFKAEKKLLEKYEEFYNRNPNAFSERTLKLGILAERLGKDEKAKSYYLQSLRHGKPTIAVVLRLLFYVLPDILAKPLSKVHDKILQQGGPHK